MIFPRKQQLVSVLTKSKEDAVSISRLYAHRKNKARNAGVLATTTKKKKKSSARSGSILLFVSFASLCKRPRDRGLPFSVPEGNSWSQMRSGGSVEATPCPGGQPGCPGGTVGPGSAGARGAPHRLASLGFVLSPNGF